MKRTITISNNTNKVAKLDESIIDILTLPYDIIKIILNHSWSPTSHLLLNLVCKRFNKVIISTNFFKGVPLPSFFPCLSVLLAYHPCTDTNVLGLTLEFIHIKTNRCIGITNSPIKDYVLAQYYCRPRFVTSNTCVIINKICNNLLLIINEIRNNLLLIRNKRNVATYFLLKYPELWEANVVDIKVRETVSLHRLQAAVIAICSDSNRRVRPNNDLVSNFIPMMWHIPIARQYWLDYAQNHVLNENCIK